MGVNVSQRVVRLVPKTLMYRHKQSVLMHTRPTSTGIATTAFLERCSRCEDGEVGLFSLSRWDLLRMKGSECIWVFGEQSARCMYDRARREWRHLHLF